MGEHIYEVEGKEVSFTTTGDILGCLCTFPNNDRADHGGKLVIDEERLISLALLGCAVAVIHNTQELEMIGGKHIYLPDDMAEYCDAIKAAVEKIKEEKE